MHFNGHCCSTCLVYKLTCKCCAQVYIGAMQNTLKERMSRHCGNVQNILKTGKDSSTLAKYSSQHSHWPNLPPNVAPKPYQIQKKINFEILYQGSPMAVVCYFGSVNCCICMQEKLEILCHSFDPEINVINSRSEIHGSCQHKPHFHRFSTDEAKRAKKLMCSNCHKC